MDKDFARQATLNAIAELTIQIVNLSKAGYRKHNKAITLINESIAVLTAYVKWCDRVMNDINEKPKTSGARMLP